MPQKKPPSVFVTFWGTRGSISTPGSSTEKYGGNTPCVSYRYADTDIILDAGTGIRNLGLELEAREEKLNLHLLLSHTHWDHIQGLPFFQPAYLPNTKISIYGSPSKGNFLEGILSRQMDINYFPVDMNAFKATISIAEITMGCSHDRKRISSRFSAMSRRQVAVKPSSGRCGKGAYM